MKSKPTIFTVLACITLSVQLCAATFRVKPYLIYPDHIEQMTLLWQTNGEPTLTTVEWGETESYGNSSTEVIAFGSNPQIPNQYQYTITGLTPNTLYFYKVTVDGQEKTGFFKSAHRPEAKKLTFYALGDTRFDKKTKLNATDRLSKYMLDDINRSLGNNTFCLHGGDWGGFAGDFFSGNKPHLQQVTSRLPIMGCCGNHDGDAFGDYYPYKDTDINGKGNHTFEYGPVFVICCRTTDPTSNHGRWIAGELAKSEKKIKIVVMHHPGWSAYTKKNKGTTRNMQSMFEANGVSMVITGHAHVYSRSMVNGMPHITFGSGSPTREVNLNAPKVVTAEAGYHYLRVDVYETYLDATTTRLDGSIVETFRLNLPGTTPPTPDYAGWSSIFPNLGDANANMDFDHGNLPTAIEYVVGGDPSNSNDDRALGSTSKIDDSGNFVYTFRRTDLSNTDGTTTIKVEYGSNLTGWTTAIDGENGVGIAVTDDGFGVGVDKVVVTLPPSLATEYAFFVRLSVDVTP